MRKRRFQLVRQPAPVAPGTARDHLATIQWSGDRPGQEFLCPTCNRARDPGAPNEGHELPDSEGNGGCLQKRIIDEPAGGGVTFSRHSPAFPDAIGCDTCQLFDTCSIRLGYDRKLIENGPTYFGLVNLNVTAGAPIARRLMVAHALEAEECTRWEERTE